MCAAAAGAAATSAAAGGDGGGGGTAADVAVDGVDAASGAGSLIRCEVSGEVALVDERIMNWSSDVLLVSVVERMMNWSSDVLLVSVLAGSMMEGKYLLISSSAGDDDGSRAKAMSLVNVRCVEDEGKCLCDR